MFSLFVAYFDTEEAPRAFNLDWTRFLEGTDSAYHSFLKPLSEEAKECLKSWPCVVMLEGRGEETAYITQVTAISASSSRITVSFRILEDAPRITNSLIYGLRAALDIESFEFLRNHWAVKERDLFKALQEREIEIGEPLKHRFTPKPMPMLSRSKLMQARDRLAALSNSGIDDIIVEAGIPSLRASASAGSSKKTRADLIVRFALDHPEAVTAENSLFSLFLLHKLPPAEGEPERLPETGTVTANAPDSVRSTPRHSDRVFIVHGHNEPIRRNNRKLWMVG